MFGLSKLNDILENQRLIMQAQLEHKAKLNILLEHQGLLRYEVNKLKDHIHTHPLRVRAATKAALEQAGQNETDTVAEELTVSGE